MLVICLSFLRLCITVNVLNHVLEAHIIHLLLNKCMLAARDLEICENQGVGEAKFRTKWFYLVKENDEKRDNCGITTRVLQSNTIP